MKVLFNFVQQIRAEETNKSEGTSGQHSNRQIDKAVGVWKTSSSNINATVGCVDTKGAKDVDILFCVTYHIPYLITRTRITITC